MRRGRIPQNVWGCWKVENRIGRFPTKWQLVIGLTGKWYILGGSCLHNIFSRDLHLIICPGTIRKHRSLFILGGLEPKYNFIIKNFHRIPSERILKGIFHGGTNLIPLLESDYLGLTKATTFCHNMCEKPVLICIWKVDLSILASSIAFNWSFFLSGVHRIYRGQFTRYITITIFYAICEGVNLGARNVKIRGLWVKNRAIARSSLLGISINKTVISLLFRSRCRVFGRVFHNYFQTDRDFTAEETSNNWLLIFSYTQVAQICGYKVFVII